MVQKSYKAGPCIVIPSPIVDKLKPMSWTMLRVNLLTLYCKLDDFILSQKIPALLNSLAYKYAGCK
jgi:hypothetical protein